MAVDLAAVLATCPLAASPRLRHAADEVALKPGQLDAVIAGLLFMAEMRRSEVSVLEQRRRGSRQ